MWKQRIVEVYVRESEGFVISGWSAEDNLKGAVRALSGFAQAAGTVAIWVVIFVPVWLVVGVVILRLRAILEAAEAEPEAARAIRIRRWLRLPYYGT